MMRISKGPNLSLSADMSIASICASSGLVAVRVQVPKSSVGFTEGILPRWFW